MANTTDVMAKSVHGTNPQNMVEYIIRQKIYDSFYWKQECFGLTAELLVEKGVELKYAGGMYGDPQKPAEFLCLILKMLQIQPDKDIIIEFIKDEEFKYLRLLGAFYMRLVGRPVDVFQYLEPLYNDFRKVRLRDSYGNFQLSYIDQVVDDMLHKDHCFDIALPRLPARRVLEETGQIEPRVSLLQDEFEAQVELEEKEDAARREREAAEAPGDAKEAGEVGPNDQGAGDGRAAIAGSEAKDRESRRRSPSPWRMSERERREDRARKRAAAEVSGEDRRGRRGEEGPAGATTTTTARGVRMTGTLAGTGTIVGTVIGTGGGIETTAGRTGGGRPRGTGATAGGGAVERHRAAPIGTAEERTRG
ncbi:hypothetical protein QBZ16_000964 [Prototheca wickerhamii]|uniref:Pre-mRNA-splicing factor 38 n=1 Tax=Prototheca wickerhamii TaxID=3111 RepID=A0AAD9MGA9_PROWI|nr:hypothetical protein QBZ16_000964 [Prototheca wickerhamii]